MLIKKLLLILPMLALIGCSGGLSYAVKNYRGVKPQRFLYADENWRIFDKPSENRLMITPSFGTAMKGGAKTGMALGLAGHQSDPENKFKTAAMMFVKEKSSTCKIIGGKLIVMPQYEYTYEC